MSTEISRSRLKIQGLDRTTCYQLDRWASQVRISAKFTSDFIFDLLNKSALYAHTANFSLPLISPQPQHPLAKFKYFQDPNSLSVDDMLDMSEEKWFNIVKDEVTVRLANAIMELLYSPGGLCQETEFKKIIQGQVQSFNEMVAAKGKKTQS